MRANGWRALLTPASWPLALAPLGALAFCLYHWYRVRRFLPLSQRPGLLRQRLRDGSQRILSSATTPIWPTPCSTWPTPPPRSCWGSSRCRRFRLSYGAVHAGLARHRA
ncbi:MAG: hypothetical protein MZV70_60775 [Desulfobacterales bacterium]|nr:hypothetical protein [Desulfobacterales bacterium]